MSMQLKAADLREDSADKKQLNVTVLLPLDGRDGFVFGVVSIHRPGTDGAGPSNVIVEHLERFAQNVGKDANAQHRFEQFLSALNETLAECVKNGDWSVPIQNVNALVGIACDAQMFLSGTGDLTAMFLHRTVEKRYQVFNLFRGIQTEQSLPTWEKTFAVVLDGDLAPGDVFCVSNRDLQRFLDAEELNAALASLPPKSAAAKIRQYFPANADLSLVIVQANEPSQAPQEMAQQLASVSLDNLVRTKDETTSYLEDQKPKPFSNVMKSVNKMRAHPVRLGIAKSMWRLALSSVAVAAKMSLNSAKWTASTTVSMAKPEARKRIVTAVKFVTNKHTRTVIGGWKRLPKMTKTLMAAAVALVLVLSFGISALQKSQVRSAELVAYQAQVTEVQGAIEKAGGAIIYKDDNQARILFANALKLANALPKDTPERAKTADQMIAQINAAFDELRHIVTIPQPTLLGELPSATGVTGRALFQSGAGIYAFGSDKLAYLLDPSTKTLNVLATTNGEIGVPTEVTSENGQTLFLDDHPEIARLDLENKLTQITNLKPDAGTRWTDLALYNGKLYVLEPTTGQIVRHNKAGNDFDGGTNWIKAKTADLTDAVSLTIDATVFVLKQSGQIVRFVGGSEVGWHQAAADPALTNPSDILTTTESQYVYVMEPSTQRLVVYKKDTGELVTQYRSDAFAGLTDFLVDEGNKVVYLLAGSKLYSITASHLK